MSLCDEDEDYPRLEAGGSICTLVEYELTDEELAELALKEPIGFLHSYFPK